jgi:DNA-binding NarL/FixJ family response regulator
MDELIIKVAITDDHPIVREGLERILQLQPHIELINTYTCGRYLKEGLKEQQPDVLLLDLQLPDIGGEDLVPFIRKQYPDMKILMLTANDSIHTIKMLLSSGANGYLLKNTELDLLIQAIEAVYLGDVFLSPEVQQKLNSIFLKSQRNTPLHNDLTAREKDVLRLIAQEKSSKEIGEALHIGYRTVENYRLVIMQKLGVKNMVGMVKKAILMGVLDE